LLNWILYRPFLQIFVELAKINKMVIELLLIRIVQHPKQKKKINTFWFILNYKSLGQVLLFGQCLNHYGWKSLWNGFFKKN